MASLHNPRTFNAAVKHLFRHFQDPKRLETNPIVSHLFRMPTDGSRIPINATQRLSKLHVLVREAAECCRDDDLAAGKALRANRQFAVLTLQYFDAIPIDQIAKRLGISIKHCYRERAEICRRIALYLYKRSPTALSERNEDGFYFLLNRLSDINIHEPRAAVQACHYLERSAHSAQQKIDALHVGIAWSLNVGDHASAQSAYLRAVRIYDEHLAPAPVELQRTAQASIKISAWRLANHLGQDAQAREEVEAAIGILEHLPTPQTTYAKEFWIDAYVDLAVTLWGVGNLAGAYDALSRALSRTDQIPRSSPLRFRVNASFWKFQNYLLLAKQHLHTAEARLEGLQGVLKQAYESGSLWEAIHTLIALIECHVFARQENRALQSARAALALIAKIPDPVMRMEVSIDVGQRLLSTKFWRHALNLLPRGGRIRRMDDYRQHALDHAYALIALKRGDFQTAWEQSKDACTGRSTLDLRYQLIAATSAHRLGRERVAREASARAVLTAERLGAVPLLRDTYEVVAEVRNDGRYARRAQEMMRMVIA